MSKSLSDLKELLRTVPTAPGVYLMKDIKGKIIYVGKAKNLKSRLSSYFQQTKTADLKTQALVKKIFDFEIIIVNNEVEALLVERSLIKHNKPAYNIKLMDDKEYPFIRVHLGDDWPRFQKVRRRKDDGALYLGPFGNAGSLRSTLGLMFQIFPLVRCSPYVFKTISRPCNYYHIKMCLAPCHLEVDRSHYFTLVKEAIEFLKGNNFRLIKDLEFEMHKQAELENFERAAGLRDVLQAVKNNQQRQKVVVNLAEADVVAFYGNEEDEEISLAIVQVRDHRIVNQETYGFLRPLQTLEESFFSFCLQYYENRFVPAELILALPFIDQKQEQIFIDALNSSLEASRIQTVLRKITITCPQKGEKAELLKLATMNARHFFENQFEKSRQRNMSLELLKELFGLDKVPMRIECIDISNLGNQGLVASNVCFIDGKPAKDLYRAYTIETVEDRQDDFASIAEVVERRIIRAQRDHDAPDLLVIDGGKGQLSSALEIAKKLDFHESKIVSLAKSRLLNNGDFSELDMPRSDERVFTAEKKRPIELKLGSPEYRLLTQIRNEAHRFAVKFHRKKRHKKTYESVLLEIPGIGAALHKKLLLQFTSIEALRQASIDELIKVRGINEDLALKIKAKLSNETI
ncbi:MAG: excinuclease ABC subunit UvrC [Oligoflexales bacterium]|nr:excinuclease ABC subunit UvrC [Oligoflexales bacterium]